MCVIGIHTLAIARGIIAKAEEKGLFMSPSNPPRIVIQLFPNPQMRYYHVNSRIADQRLYASLGVQGLQYEIKRVDAATIAKALSFYDIEGVTGVGLNIYSVDIEISPAFRWEDLEPRIVEIIRKHLHWDEDPVIELKDSRNMN